MLGLLKPLFFLVLPGFFHAQSLLLTGRVFDEKGAPLEGVHVLDETSNAGTFTDSTGYFQMQVRERGAVLRFTAVGFHDHEEVVGEADYLEVVLYASHEELREVVVVGFGALPRRALGASVSSLRGEVFVAGNAPSFQRMLQGRLSGVVVTNASGGLNAESIIRIRGTGSIAAGNQPLVVVDGLVLASRPGGSLGYTTNPFLNLDPNDIASLEVLKDAAATAIYGARGANGVLLITTRRGRFESPPEVELGYRAGFAEISKRRSLLTGPEYARVWNEGALNAGYTPEENPEIFYPDPDSEPSTDWQDLLLRKGFVQEVNARVSGGSESSAYYIAGTLRDEDHYLRTVGLQRRSLRMNLQQKLGEKIILGIGLSPSQTRDQRTGNQWAGSAWGWAGWYYPNLEALDEQGRCRRELLRTSNGQEGGFPGNPCTVLEDQWIRAVRNQLLFQTRLSWSPLPRLRLQTAWGSEYSDEDQQLKFGAATFFGRPSGWALESHQQTLNHNWTSTLEWNTDLQPALRLDATLGFHLSREQHDFLTVDGSGFGDDRLRRLGAASQIEFVGSSESEARFLGYFGRFLFSARDRYFFTLSARYDGSSRFGTSKRYGLFPALAAGWLLSEEPFFDFPAFDYLKLRSSIGLAGNASIDDFAARALVDYGAQYSGAPGFVLQSLENPELSWEKSLQWNAGVDFSLFAGRLLGTLEYFFKDTRDLLFLRPIPASNGFSFLPSNVGAIRNQGLELQLEARILRRGAFQWRVLLNAATLRNEVRHLPDQDGDGREDDIILNQRMLLRPGLSLGTFYLVRYAGVDPANGDALFYDLEGEALPNTAPDAHRQLAGKSIPSVTGGFTHLFRFGAFDLQADFHFKAGHHIYMEDRNLEHTLGFGGNMHRSQLDAWTPQNPNTDVPQHRLYQNNGNQESTRFLDRADFLRLQQLTLGYTLQAPFGGKSRLRLFASANNLWTLTGFRGLDPDNEFYPAEGPALGTVRYNLPATRYFTLGFHLKP